MTSSIVFIDSRVADYQTLIAGLAEGTEWFLLNAEEDGIDQMAAILANYANLESIHVISHGSEGALYFGDTVLNSENITSYESPLQTIGSSLNDTGDILLYGCNVSAGETGQAFVAQLAIATGADVAASTDATGSALLAGNWILEAATGSVETAPITSTSGDFNTLLEANTAPTFILPGDGKLTTAIGTGNDVGNDVAVQADGKILVAGASHNYYDNDFVLVRYNTDGSLDTTFDGDGKLTTAIGTMHDESNSVTVQADGKILVAGTSQNSNYDFALARYNTDGSLDTTFDGDGKLTTGFGFSSEYGNSVTVQADGKILVAGRRDASSDPTSADFALARYNTNGSLDTTFDGDGKLTTGIGTTYDEGYSVTVQADGKILVAGITQNSNYDFALVRYNVNGSLDTSFSGDGKVTTDFDGTADYGYSVTVQADGKILVAGYSNDGTDSDFALVRYNTDGSLDTTFDGDGKITTDISSSSSDGDAGYSVTLQADGKILVAGYSNDGTDSDFALVRYNTDGSLDTTFDGDGKLTTAIGTMHDESNSVTVQADGKILVAGQSYNGADSDLALVRYNTDGSLDTTFDSVSTLDGTPGYTENSSAVVLDANVQILDAELSAVNSYNNSTLTLSRHEGANSQDSFSAKSGGTLTTLLTGSYFAVDSVTIGRVTTNSEGTVVLTFNANATQSLVTQAMQQIAYANTSDAPPASVQIDWTFNDGNTGAQGDGGSLSVTGSTTMQITAVNDAPTLTTALPDLVVQPDATLSYVIPSTTFMDPDGESLTYSIALTDGTGVPPWLTFSSATRTLSGSPTSANTGSLSVHIRAHIRPAVFDFT